MRKLKIAYLLPYLGVGGGIAVVFQHANRLLKRGHDVIIASQVPLTPAGWFPNQAVRLVEAEDLPDDLDILVATAWQTPFDVARLKAKCKCYFVQSDETRFHEYGNDYFHITQLSYLMNFFFLTEAKWIKNWLFENFGKTASLIPNGLDRELFYPDSPLEKKTDKKRILLEGAIDIPYKGMREAFEAVKDLDVEIWCVSSFGQPKPEWKCHKFFEAVPMTEMRRIYSSCDILLKMSKVEGFFGPPLEMMACGGVCVVGKVTGYDEYIVDGENALVIEPSDIKGATEAIKRLITDEKLTGKLRENGLKTAKEWDWESSIDRLEEYFFGIADGRHGHFSPAQEQTNQSIGYFFEKKYDALPHIPCSQLFIDTGLGFKEEQSLMRRIDDKGIRRIEFDLNGFDSIKNIRFDPINDYAAVRIDEITVHTKSGGCEKITDYRHNGIAKNNYLFFITNDPQIYINFKNIEKPEKLTVSLNFIAIGPEILKERNVDLEKEVQGLEKEVQGLEKGMHGLEKEVQGLNDELVGIHASQGWKFLLKCRRIKEKFFPLRSKRRMLLQRLFDAIK